MQRVNFTQVSQTAKVIDGQHNIDPLGKEAVTLVKSKKNNKDSNAIIMAETSTKYISD